MLRRIFQAHRGGMGEGVALSGSEHVLSRQQCVAQNPQSFLRFSSHSSSHARSFGSQRAAPIGYLGTCWRSWALSKLLGIRPLQPCRRGQEPLSQAQVSPRDRSVCLHRGSVTRLKPLTSSRSYPSGCPLQPATPWQVLTVLRLHPQLFSRVPSRCSQSCASSLSTSHVGLEACGWALLSALPPA